MHNSELQELPHHLLVQLLVDSQQQLAVALGRIELHRIRERRLAQELAELRKVLYGGSNSKCTANGSSLHPEASASDTSASHSPVGCSSLDSSTQSGASPASQAPQSNQPQFTSVGDNGKPLYVTSLEPREQHGAVLHQGANRVGCSLIVTKDFIDFVEVHARVHRDHFVGISSSKERPKGPTQGGGLLSALASRALNSSTIRAHSDSNLASNNPSSEPSSTGTSNSSQSQYQQQHHQQQQQPLSWEVHIRSGHGMSSIKFSASQTTRGALHKHTEKWLGNTDASEDSQHGSEPNSDSSVQPTVSPTTLLPKPSPLVLLAEPSHIMGSEAQAALASAVPPLELMRPWRCSYSSFSHGVSLGTLYRRMRPGLPAITVVQDTAGYVFGCYTSEGWRISPRYYGSGECFVFQLEPHRCMWRWRSRSRVKNDFFMLSSPECLALGSLGHFALHIDQELLQGSSDTCGTFGSPCLASKEDFKCRAVEVWQPSV